MQFWTGLVSAGEGRIAHLVICEHEGMVPAAGCWEWVGAGTGSQQGRPAEDGSALLAEEQERTGGSMAEMLS